jgi:hypothetical protein
MWSHTRALLSHTACGNEVDAGTWWACVQGNGRTTGVWCIDLSSALRAFIFRNSCLTAPHMAQGGHTQSVLMILMLGRHAHVELDQAAYRTRFKVRSCVNHHSSSITQCDAPKQVYEIVMSAPSIGLPVGVEHCCQRSHIVTERLRIPVPQIRPHSQQPGC